MITTAAVVTAIALLTAGWVRLRYLVTRVDGPSMQPTFHDGDRLLARRGNHHADRGQVVVFRNPRPVGVPGSSSGPLLLKRVVAVAGDEVHMGATPERVPAGHVMVLGDNAAQSLDSRHLGYIPAANIIGTVLRRMGN
ncbi:signal peptidase I [Phytomonospora endophytica]|uniref:Signal peptidase I n=1 Tax=Phytomonospora endophytica TaxID=714109 RepID=A0A841FSP2_9ACTN|nr:signal peptidase I [Phytomonospora endophytica]MBB6038824.1 signal peptidase I [Phytomonospora endophytica]GIG68380.1 S26 family signal peptidase [Phytomonospora endophytica]